MNFLIFYEVNIIFRKADIRNPLSLLAHERSRFATCQWEFLTPTDISIPLTHCLVLYALERRNAYSAFIYGYCIIYPCLFHEKTIKTF